MCKNNYLNTCPVNVTLFWNCVLRKIIKFSPYFRKQGLICAVPKLVVNQGVVGVLVSTIVWKAEGMGSFPIGAPNIMYPQILSYQLCHATWDR